MARRITITAGQARVQAELNDTVTARAILEALPLEARASRWGGEIYFSIPVEEGLEGSAREVLQPGEIGFWPPGWVRGFRNDCARPFPLNYFLRPRLPDGTKVVIFPGGLLPPHAIAGHWGRHRPHCWQ